MFYHLIADDCRGEEPQSVYFDAAEWNGNDFTLVSSHRHCVVKPGGRTTNTNANDDEEETEATQEQEQVLQIGTGTDSDSTDEANDAANTIKDSLKRRLLGKSLPAGEYRHDTLEWGLEVTVDELPAGSLSDVPMVVSQVRCSNPFIYTLYPPCTIVNNIIDVVSDCYCIQDKTLKVGHTTWPST